MVNTSIRWYGLLCNVDMSILQIQLSRGFQIKYFNEKDAIEHLISIEMIKDHRGFYNRFLMDLPIFNNDEKRLYYLYNEEKADVELTDDGSLAGLPALDSEQNFNQVIRNNIRLLRLFNGGDIRVPIRYACYDHNGTWRNYYSISSHKFISLKKFQLNKNEMSEINTLFTFELPFKVKEIQLAFDSYEDSFETSNRALSFLSLMIALECLFNLGKGELRYRISRNCAVLLGNNVSESIEVFKEIKNIYDTRSDLVHSGASNKLNDDMILRIKDYVRKSILKMLFLGESKKIILMKLNQLGFGEIEKYYEYA